MRKENSISRRHFLKQAGVGSAGFALTSTAAVPKAGSGDKLNIGIIGAGGRGWDNLMAVATENIVALCDVDEERSSEARQKFPQAKGYKDFRQMLDREKSLDAVVISTPDHTHAICAVTAMRMGKHVYCEKPLGHSIYEVRRMRDVAREQNVITQMGQQGHAFEGTRRAVEKIRAGVIGQVREVHVWTDRPAGWWPQGERRPIETPPVPATLDWDLWVGPAPMRPYHPVYVPFKWRGRWDFGTGSIGDMGVHNLDTAFWALELGVPSAARVIASDQKTEDCPPLWSIIEMEYPARGKQPPVKLRFYDGKKLPPEDLFNGEARSANGSLIIGSKGTLYTRDWHGGQNEGDMHWLLPRKEFAGLTPPAPSLPRTGEHHQEWIAACKGGPATQSNFGYAARLTEGLLIGCLALRTGKEIRWDSDRMKAIGLPEADKYIKPEFRQGWEI